MANNTLQKELQLLFTNKELTENDKERFELVLYALIDKYKAKLEEHVMGLFFQEAFKEDTYTNIVPPPEWAEAYTLDDTILQDPNSIKFLFQLAEQDPQIESLEALLTEFYVQQAKSDVNVVEPMAQLLQRVYGNPEDAEESTQNRRDFQMTTMLNCYFPEYSKAFRQGLQIHIAEQTPQASTELGAQRPKYRFH